MRWEKREMEVLSQKLDKKLFCFFERKIYRYEIEAHLFVDSAKFWKQYSYVSGVQYFVLGLQIEEEMSYQAKMAA